MSGKDKAERADIVQSEVEPGEARAEPCEIEAGPDAAPDDAREASQEAAGAETESDMLRLELEQVRAELEGSREEVLRARAEVDNIRKRAQRDVEAAHRYGLERFVGEFLAVKDSMELGYAAAQEAANVQSLREGMDLTLKMFDTALERVGVQEIDPVGEKFDPEFHEAMTMQESAEAESGTVLRVMQKGYTLNGRLVRPAMVIVAKPIERSDAADA